MNEELTASLNADLRDPQLSYRMSNLEPSDDDFDKSSYTDAEYIMLLKKQILNLQMRLSNQEILINQLKISSGEDAIFLSNGSESVPRKEGIGTPEAEVPQRSARRNEEPQLDSQLDISRFVLSSPVKVVQDTEEGVSATFAHRNGPFHESGGKYLSPDLRNELLASKSLSFKVTTGSLDEANELKPTSSKSTVKLENNKGGSFAISCGTYVTAIEPSIFNIASGPLDLIASNSMKQSLSDDLVDQESSPTTGSFTPRSRTHLSKTTSSPKPKAYLLTDGPTSCSFLPTLSADPDSRIDSDPLSHLHQPPEINNRETSDRVAAISHECLEENNGSVTSRVEPRTPDSNGMGTPTTNDADYKSACNNTLSGKSETKNLERDDTKYAICHSPRTDEEEDSLFIKPKDFFTVRIHVVSTISANCKSADEYSCTFSVNDRETGKEMWRIRKSYAQIVSFDAAIRPFIEFFGLPLLPDKSTFCSAIPVKVSFRSQALQRYFDTIVCMPHIPQIVLLKICRYMSVDFVNPLDDFRSGAKKEGFLIRRYKGLGTTWKVRWCQIDGPILEIYDVPGGLLIEQIKLFGSQIGRQSTDIAAEDRGYRHAFLVLESSRSSKLSAHSPKHFFCAESDNERDEWIEAMVEFTENDTFASDDKSIKTQSQWPNLESSLIPGVDDIQCPSGDGIQINRRKDSPISVSESASDLDSIQKSVDDQSQRQYRKTKKRHLFPFRSIRAPTEDLEVNSLATPAVILDEPSSEQDMQTYLNKLDLSKESSKAIFGRDLPYIFTLSNHDFEGMRIPSICFRCFDFLKKTGAIYDEGIFRLSGSASAIRNLKEMFNKHLDIDLLQSPLKPDVHTVAGLLKTFLRELPHSMFGEIAYYEIQRIFTENRRNHSVSEICLMVKEFVRKSLQVDEVHFNLSLAVLSFLRLVIANSSTNKMSLKNVCIVFVPTLNISVDILSLCLTDFDCIFADLPPVQDHMREVLDLHIPSF